MTTDEITQRPFDRNGRLVVKPGMEVFWIDVAANGYETRRSGQVWSLAKHMPGRGRCFWVRTADNNDLVLICLTGRRHRIGAIHRSKAGRRFYVKRAGRYMDKGEIYREAFSGLSGSPFYHQVRPAPTHVSGHPVGSVAQIEMENWTRTLDALAAGQEVDLSVSAEAAAAEANRPEASDDDD